MSRSFTNFLCTLTSLLFNFQGPLRCPLADSLLRIPHTASLVKCFCKTFFAFFARCCLRRFHTFFPLENDPPGFRSTVCLLYHPPIAFVKSVLHRFVFFSSLSPTLLLFRIFFDIIGYQNMEEYLYGQKNTAYGLELMEHIRQPD